MAKIEQCEHCFRYKRGTYEMKCSWLGAKPNYDDLECEHFEDKEVRDKKKQERDNRQQIIHSKSNAYRIAHNMLIEGKSPEQKVIDELVRRGMSTDDAESVVSDVQLRKKNYNNQIVLGIVLCIFSIVLTFVLRKDDGIAYGGGLFVIGVGWIVVASIKSKRSNWEMYEPTLHRNLAKNDSIEDSSHIYVDLGLPSGTLWATCNVGADSPEEYGKYYAWGTDIAKDEYGDGKYDAKNIDTAAAIWGGKWRMPTEEEFNELIFECESEWVVQNGVKGCRFTGNNGSCIFMPAAGLYRYEDTGKTAELLLVKEGKRGCYWSGTSRAFESCYLYFEPEVCETLLTENRKGEYRTVRPVCK